MKANYSSISKESQAFQFTSSRRATFQPTANRFFAPETPLPIAMTFFALHDKADVFCENLMLASRSNRPSLCLSITYSCLKFILFTLENFPFDVILRRELAKCSS